MLPVVLRVKELNIKSYTLYWNLKSSFSRSDSWRPRNDALIFAPREGTWIEVLGGENALLTIDSIAMRVADFGLWVHTLLGFKDSNSRLKLF